MAKIMVISGKIFKISLAEQLFLIRMGSTKRNSLVIKTIKKNKNWMECETVQRAEALELLRGVVERHPFFIAWVIFHSGQLF